MSHLHFSGSNPVLIASPPELAGMTLESRLISYDWENQFDVFQKVTRNGSLRPICFDAKNNVLQVSNIIWITNIFLIYSMKFVCDWTIKFLYVF